MSKDAKIILKELQRYLAGQNVRELLMELLPRFVGELPDGVSFWSDIWNLVSWSTKPGNARVANIHFDKIQSSDLKQIAKIFVLSRRFHKKIEFSAVYMYISAIQFIDSALGFKKMEAISTENFYMAQKLIVNKYPADNSLRYRLPDAIESFGKWMTRYFALRISYVNKLTSWYVHGRRASEEGREAKLLHIGVIHELLAAFRRSNLSKKDKFYLAAFALDVPTGLRIKELTTLPKDCLIKIGAHYALIYYPEKGGKVAPHPIPDEAVPFVKEALKFIIEITEPGREIAKRLKETPSTSVALDWVDIMRDETATEYFVGKFAHEWTANARNNLLNPQGAWFEKKKSYIDVISLVKKTGSKGAAARALNTDRRTIDDLLAAQEAVLEGRLPSASRSCGRKERTNWDLDSRMISIQSLRRYADRQFHKQDRYEHIISKAQECQLRGEVYPCPPYNEVLESKYNRSTVAVIKDKQGKVLLDATEALFVTRKYEFSEQRPTKDNNFTFLTERPFSRWLDGATRSKGTGNHEDAVCRRLNIIDPKTGKIAEFTSHDVRHWLDTMYSEGGLDEAAIALIFGRKSKGANHLYDQTPKKKRLENLQAGIREGKVLGHIAETYSRLAKISREEAEQYLKSTTMQISIMPHGNCMMPWRSNGCPNFMSCFSIKKGCCDHLQVDLSDESERAEIESIHREATSILAVMPVSSPQYKRFVMIKENTESMLSRNGGCR